MTFNILLFYGGEIDDMRDNRRVSRYFKIFNRSTIMCGNSYKLWSNSEVQAIGDSNY